MNGFSQEKMNTAINFLHYAVSLCLTALYLAGQIPIEALMVCGCVGIVIAAYDVWWMCRLLHLWRQLQSETQGRRCRNER